MYLTLNQLDSRKVLSKWCYVMCDITASGVFGICMLEPEAKLRVMAGQLNAARCWATHFNH